VKNAIQGCNNPLNTDVAQNFKKLAKAVFEDKNFSPYKLSNSMAFLCFPDKWSQCVKLETSNSSSVTDIMEGLS